MVEEISYGSIAQEFLVKTVEDTFDFLIRKYNLSIGKYKDKYRDYCGKHLHIKTLASQDKPVFIDDIYVPLTLRGGSLPPFDVTDSTLLDLENRAVLIRGLAGQGKSTVLRKLLKNTLKLKSSFPVFYEFKHYRGESIETSLSNYFSLLGINIENDGVEKILNDSNTRLYLDAFDEAPPNYRPELLTQIQVLINKYKCKIVCTSRPDTEIDSLTDFDTHTVDPLTHDQIMQLIHKTTTDIDKAKELCIALDKTPLHNENESILKSPILVVLYCISYNLGEEIPDTLSQFYANIFDTVFFRHDNIKGKVNRIRHWNDNRRIYRDLFDCLCFISQRSGSASFDRELLTHYLSESLNYMNIKDEVVDKICNELITITNLIIEDGFNEYRFVHKSIQEFFSASFICHLNYKKKCSFYNKCSSEYVFYNLFSNTLFFLKEVDYYDYCEHFIIPSVSNLLGISNEQLENSFSPSQELVESFLVDVKYRVKYEKIFNKQTKLYEEVVEQYLPSIDSTLKASEAKVRLFNFCAQKLLSLNFHDLLLVRFIVKHGNHIDSGCYSAPLSMVANFFSVNKQDTEIILLTGIEILFRNEYNKALNDLASRQTTLTSGNYFDF